MKINRLFLPPTLRLPGGERGRHATWLELFYDLIFVVAVGQLATRLSADPSTQGIAEFVALFMAIWWAWVGHTVYSTRFDTDDVFHRVLTFLKMLAAAGMAIQVPHALDGGGSMFAAFYVGARVCLLVLYIRAACYVPEARRMTSLYVVGFGLGAGVVAISIFTPPPLQYKLWALGLSIDLLTPWIGRRILQQAPLDTSHLPERLGLFTIIVLGESVLGNINGVAHVHWQVDSILSGAMGFVFIVCLWWLYFVSLDYAHLDSKLGSGQPYIYSHIPLLVTTASIGVGIEHIIIEASNDFLSEEASRILCGSLIIWLLSFSLIKNQTSSHAHMKIFVLPFSIAITIIALLWYNHGALKPATFMFMITSVVFSLVVTELLQRKKEYRLENEATGAGRNEFSS